MPTAIEATPPDSLRDVNLTPRRMPANPSPSDWRDQILYFMLPDRFCDELEHTRQKFDFMNPSQVPRADKATWMSAGKSFQRGTIKGIKEKLPYLKELGVSALWIGPVFKQRPDLDTYHGYGIQDFLDVDPRFGTRQDLRDLVDLAHDEGIYIILDIIYNHSGNNWFYEQGGNPYTMLDYKYEPPYPIHGWRSSTGQSTNTINTRDDGVWPAEFGNIDWYTRAGKIGNWDPKAWENPLDPRNEFRRGDFYDLKDLKLNEYEYPSQEVLNALIKVYQYWIALTDCDGMRVDTVKHVSFEASRNFCGAIHEYAESIGKQNFLILGEVTGGAEMTRSYLEIFGRNLDAAIDLGGPMDTVTNFVKGLADPMVFFNQFGGHDELGSHRLVGRYHVAMFDDHDMISRDPKRRFSAQNNIANHYQQVAHAVGVQLTTLGIPCIYYGTEQAFDGWEGYHDLSIEPLGSDGKIPFRDRYIREAMFGSTFGAFQTSGHSFFNTTHPTYLRIGAIARVVSRDDSIGLALRRGRQYPREVRFNGGGYLPPQKGELVAWSRILFDREVIIALNTNGTESRGGDVTVDANLHKYGSSAIFLYRGEWSDQELKNPPAGQTITVKDDHGRATIRIDLPPAGMAILA